jgi:hypothetical protein
MGYGSRALTLLKKYYEFKIPSIEEDQLPQEHIKSVEDEKVGLLEERIGKLFILTYSVHADIVLIFSIMHNTEKMGMVQGSFCTRRTL